MAPEVCYLCLWLAKNGFWHVKALKEMFKQERLLCDADHHGFFKELKCFNSFNSLISSKH